MKRVTIQELMLLLLLMVIVGIVFLEWMQEIGKEKRVEKFICEFSNFTKKGTRNRLRIL